MKGYRHNNMHLQRGAAIQRDKDRMFLLKLNLRNVNINMLTDNELKFLAEHEAEHIRVNGHPSGGPDRTRAGHSNATIRGYHELPYYVYTESDSYPDGHSYRTANGDAGWGELPDVPAVDNYLPGTNIYKHPKLSRHVSKAKRDYQKFISDSQVPWSLSRGDWSHSGSWEV